MTMGEEVWHSGRLLAEKALPFKSSELPALTELKRAIYLDAFVEGYLASMHDADERSPIEGPGQLLEKMDQLSTVMRPVLLLNESSGLIGDP